MRIKLIFMSILFFISSCGVNTLTPPPSQTPKPPTKPPATIVPTKQIILNGCVTDSTIRIREKPGTEFNVIGGMTSGTCFKILGRNADGSWVYIVTNENSKGWVAAWIITVQGDLQKVPITSRIVSVTPTLNLNNSRPPESNQNCMPAYPDVCIPPGRDLDCKDIPYRNFRVPGGDPFNFDLDYDGIGCET